MVKEQFEVDGMVDITETRFQFDISGTMEPIIAIDFTRQLSGKWAVTKETTYHQVMLIMP